MRPKSRSTPPPDRTISFGVSARPRKTPRFPAESMSPRDPSTRAPGRPTSTLAMATPMRKSTSMAGSARRSQVSISSSALSAISIPASRTARIMTTSSSRLRRPGLSAPPHSARPSITHPTSSARPKTRRPMSRPTPPSVLRTNGRSPAPSAINSYPRTSTTRPGTSAPPIS